MFVFIKGKDCIFAFIKENKKTVTLVYHAISCTAFEIS